MLLAIALQAKKKDAKKGKDENYKRTGYSQTYQAHSHCKPSVTVTNELALAYDTRENELMEDHKIVYQDLRWILL